MGGYISFAKFNRKHLYIIFSITFLILKDVAFGYNYNDSFDPLFHDQSYENFSEHYLIKNILCYIATFIFSFILYTIEKNNSGRITLNKSDFEENSSISYISDDSYANFFSRSNLSLNLIIFMWILYENLIQIFSFLKDLDFWMIEIIIISYISSVMLKTKIYLHHKMIIYLNLIPIIFKIIAITISFQDKCNKVNGGDYFYSYNYNYKSNNFSMCLSRNEIKSFNKNIKEYTLNGGLRNYYVMNSYLVPLGIFLYIIFITLRSYINSSIKWLMELKYISEKKILMIYGLMGAIISFILCIITTFKNCKDNEDESNIYDYICKVKYNNKIYFDNFKAVYQTLKAKKYVWITILKTFFGIICFYINKYFSMLIIKNFTPVHLILCFPVYYITQKIILIINTLVREKKFFSVNRINYIEAKFLLDILGDILSSLGFLVYLEIIELNFCGLNYNLKGKISERADEEKFEKYILGNEDEEENEDENVKEREMKNSTLN